MNEYSKSEISYMRQDAIRRTREMHRKSQQTNLRDDVKNSNTQNTHKMNLCDDAKKSNATNMHNMNLCDDAKRSGTQNAHNAHIDDKCNNRQSENNHKSEENKKKMSPPPKKSEHGNPLNFDNLNTENILNSLFPNMKFDNEKILIIAVLILLAKEGADLKLILAMGYMLL